jgi:hydroxymethylbilane synthase
MQISRFRIGARGSRLAIIQAEEVRARLIAAHGLAPEQVEISTIVTTGDRIQDRNLTEIGGKGLFTKEIEEALLNMTIDLAVHSMKDLPALIPTGLSIAGILRREDPRDALVSSVASSLDNLPRGARIGSSSVRRVAQLRRKRNDLVFSPFRGNVETRLKKLKEGEVDATLLACAGLNRLGLQKEIASVIDVMEMLPALGQGAIGVEIRECDRDLADAVRAISDDETEAAITCERAFLKELDGSCKTPIAGFAYMEDGRLHFRGETLTADGHQVFTAARVGLPAEAAVMGIDAGVEVKSKGGQVVI